jgi:outer membrane protein insertion porin family
LHGAGLTGFHPASKMPGGVGAVSTHRMKSFSSRYRRLLALVIACLQMAAVAQQPPPQPPIEAITIRHVGPAAVSDELVRANIRTRVGDPFNRIRVDDDVRNLLGTGYFYNVRVGEEPTEKGVKLTYVVQGKPVLTEVRFSGNKKYSVNKLRKKVTSKIGEPLDERKLFEDSLEILKLYQKAGLQKTKVEPKPVINEGLGKGTVTFEITEAPKVRITDVEFENATAFKQGKLRRVIKTRRWWWMSWITGSGKLKDEQFEEDKEKLRDFYNEEGYIDFDLRDVKFDYATTNRMTIRFDVSEGTPYKVSGVDFKGNEVFTKEQILANLRDNNNLRTKLTLTPGETFTPKQLQKDVDAIENFYGSQGYIDARVAPQKIANIEQGALDLQYNVLEGEKFYLEKIEIKGNTKTKDKVIRRELAVSPGEPFDMVRVKISKQRLEQMGYFEKVDTSNEPTSVENRRDLVIGVEEKNTGNIALGAGFSSVDKLVGFVEVTQGNFDLFNPPYFTGGGQKARLRLQYGTRRQDYIVGFTEPWFLGRRLRLDTELFFRELNYYSDNFTQTQVGGRVGLTKQLPFNLTAGVTYTLENIDIEFSDSYKLTYPPGGPQPVLLQEEGSRLVSRVGLSLAHDTRNSVTLPTRGHRLELSPEIVGGPFGGDVDFFKVELRAAQYWSPARLFDEGSLWRDVFDGHVVELTGRVGSVEPYSRGDRGNSGRVPLFDRFFLGGLYSLRGFDYRDVGPRDELTLEPIGGNTYWFGSAEYSVPIIERLRIAVFYDAGMVFPDSFSFKAHKYADGSSTGSYNDNFGFGLRLNLPIGPLRLDYGIPRVSDKYNDSGGQFQFGVGYTRDF